MKRILFVLSLFFLVLSIVVACYALYTDEISPGLGIIFLIIGRMFQHGYEKVKQKEIEVENNH